MGQYIGLDLGTSSITALVLDAQSGHVIVKHTMRNDTATTSSDDQARGRSEWDIDRMMVCTVDLLQMLVTKLDDQSSIEGIGVTGQQHGMVLMDRNGQPCTPFIGWQDRRCLDTLEETTYLNRMIELGGKGFERSEYLPARGYMGSTLFWLSQQKMLPDDSHAAFAPDMLVSRLCGQPPVTDPTNAAGSGVFDVIERRWNTELLNTLDIPESVLPVVHAPCSWMGTLQADIARKTGLPTGLPVANACGDNQASFAGSVADYDNSLLVNIGTGGQISVYNDEPVRIDGLLVRPYLKEEGHLLVGAGMTGGRSYGVLERFIQQVGQQVFGMTNIPELYDRLDQLALEVPSGADGLRCEPIFSGSLREPQRRGVWSGMSDTNMTPGHLARSLLEGMAEQFSLMYLAMKEAGVTPRPKLIGAGNGIRKNKLLGHLISDALELPLQIVRHTEEAAFGAALCASVAAVEFSDIEAAGHHCLRYNAQ